MDTKAKARAIADLSNRILEIVDLDAPRSDVQGCAEALASELADAIAAARAYKSAVREELELLASEDSEERDGPERHAASWAAARRAAKLDAALAKFE